jgi:D-glycero-D-manno-heptose 1,7-bisphosphate phosphatase
MDHQSTTITRRRALFLDPDGVINVEKSYVHKIKDFEFADGIFRLCRVAVNSGMLVVVVANQAGICRSLYTKADFWQLTNWMNDHFERAQAPIAKAYYCTFHPECGLVNIDKIRMTANQIQGCFCVPEKT